MPKVRMQGLIKRGFAEGVKKTTNPEFFLPSYGGAYDDLIDKGLIRVAGGDANKTKASIREDLTFHRGESICLLKEKAVISTYSQWGTADAAYKVEGKKKAFPTLKEALKSVGFDVEAYEAL